MIEQWAIEIVGPNWANGLGFILIMGGVVFVVIAGVALVGFIDKRNREINKYKFEKEIESEIKKEK